MPKYSVAILRMLRRAYPPDLELSEVAFRHVRVSVVIDAHEVRHKAHRLLQKSDRPQALELLRGPQPRLL
jgi:hypothetical protein